MPQVCALGRPGEGSQGVLALVDISACCCWFPSRSSVTALSSEGIHCRPGPEGAVVCSSIWHTLCPFLLVVSPQREALGGQRPWCGGEPGPGALVQLCSALLYDLEQGPAFSGPVCSV